ncbi:colicin V production protein [Clostridium sp. CAG:575]|nr:colicin V production protein [Clostridium sp. CAG:575]
MGILIDIIFIAIILLSAFLGYKKGLVNMASKLFAGILAIIITLILYQPVSNAIIKNTPLQTKIENIIIEKTQTENQEENSNVINELSQNMIKEQAKNISINVVHAITMIGIFLLVKIILSIVFALINGIANLPILKQFNEVGGIAYGLVRGAIISVICIALLGVYAKINPQNKINTEIENTYLTKIVYKNIIKF